MDAPSFELQGVRRRFGRKVVLASVDLELTGGEHVALQGGNGAGKTTLLRIAAGLLRPSAGRVLVDGRPMNRRAARLWGVGYCPQENVHYQELSVEENIAFAARLHGTPRWGVGRAVSAALTHLDLHDLARTKAGCLSGGQQRRLSIACATAHGPSLLFMEEPEAGVDAATTGKIAAHLASLDTTAIWTTHDAGMAAAAGRKVWLAEGVITDRPTDGTTPAMAASRRAVGVAA